MNFKELQTLVIQKLQENPTPEYWSLDEIKGSINRGYLEFVKQTGFLRERVEVGEIGSGYCKVPKNAIKILNAYYNGKALTPVSVEQLDRASFSKDILRTNHGEPYTFTGYWAEERGEPVFWTFINGQIRLVPYPDTWDTDVVNENFGLIMADDFGLLIPDMPDGDVRLQVDSDGFGGVAYLIDLYPVFIEIVRTPEPLVNDTDEPELPFAFHEALAYYALYDLFSREGTTQDLRKAGYYMQLFNGFVQQALSFFVPRTLQLRMPFKV